MFKKLKEAVLHPATVTASILGTVASAMWLPVDPTMLTALGATVWAHAGTLFSAGSALAFLSRGPLAASFGWVQPIALGLGAAGAILYAAKLLDRFLDDYQDRL